MIDRKYFRIVKKKVLKDEEEIETPVEGKKNQHYVRFCILTVQEVLSIFI